MKLRNNKVLALLLTASMVSSTLTPAFAYAQESDLLPVEETTQEQVMDEVFSEEAAAAASEGTFDEADIFEQSLEDAVIDAGFEESVPADGEDIRAL